MCAVVVGNPLTLQIDPEKSLPPCSLFPSLRGGDIACSVQRREDEVRWKAEEEEESEISISLHGRPLLLRLLLSGPLVPKVE